MRFGSGKQMCEFINLPNDLYNEETEKYVFLYSEDGDICVYEIPKEKARELAEKKVETGEYWEAFLGFGGEIFENAEAWCADNYKGEWKVV